MCYHSIEILHSSVSWCSLLLINCFYCQIHHYQGSLLWWFWASDCQSGGDRKRQKEVSFEKCLYKESLIWLIPELVKWPISFLFILPLSVHMDKFIFLGESLHSSFRRGAVVYCLIEFRLFFLICKVSDSCFNLLISMLPCK